MCYNLWSHTGSYVWRAYSWVKNPSLPWHHSNFEFVLLSYKRDLMGHLRVSLTREWCDLCAGVWLFCSLYNSSWISALRILLLTQASSSRISSEYNTYLMSINVWPGIIILQRLYYQCRENFASNKRGTLFFWLKNI